MSPIPARSPWKPLLILVPVLAGAGVLVLSLRSDRGPVVPVESGAPELGQEGGRRPGLFVQEPATHAEPLDLTLSCDVLERLPTALGQGPATLELRSTSFGRPQPVELRFVAGPHAGEQRRLEGSATLIGLVPGWQLCELEAPDGRRTRRLFRLREGSAGELQVDWSHAGRLHGHVFDDHGAPVAGAEIALGAQGTRTDAEGRFALDDLVCGGAQPLYIAAEGRASKLGIVSVVAGTGEPREFRFQLDPGVERTLVVQLPAGEMRFVRFVVLPRKGGADSSEDFPFAWLGRYADVAADADGRVVLPGLPQDRPLAVGLVHPRFRLDAPVPLDNECVGSGPALIPITPVPLTVEAVARPAGGRDGNWGMALFRGEAGPALPAMARALGGVPAQGIGTRPRVSLRLELGVPANGSPPARPLRVRVVRDGVEQGDPRVVDPRDGLVLDFERPVRIRLRLEGIDGLLAEREVLVDGVRRLDLWP